jgi:hypothetical protein
MWDMDCRKLAKTSARGLTDAAKMNLCSSCHGPFYLALVDTAETTASPLSLGEPKLTVSPTRRAGQNGVGENVRSSQSH